MERTAEKGGRRGRKRKDTGGKKDVKARDGENLKKKSIANWLLLL